jgi:hypothetical protein
MTDFTIETSKIPGGYSFRRSDGQQFFMVLVGNQGNARLYAGNSADKPPAEAIVEFDYTVSDKLAACRSRILGYK